MVKQDFPASFYINKDNSALQLDHAVSQTQVEQHSAPWGFCFKHSTAPGEPIIFQFTAIC